MRTTHLLPLLGLLTCTSLHANNIQVTNTTLVDNTGSTVKVQFDISWENSWRGGGVNNWDAAWVFVKYKLSNGGWEHAYPGSSGHTAPAGSMIELGLLTPGAVADPASNPVVGVFIRRDTDGNGTFTANGVQLFWDYSSIGNIALNDLAEVQVFAIEMVYVNEGSFRLGSGGSEPAHFNISGPGNNAYVVNSENAINTGSTAPIGQFYLWADDHIEEGTIPAAFPKGFAASYAMKYEISQQQYVDFLHTLTRSQQAGNVSSDISEGQTTVGAATYVMSGTASSEYRNQVRLLSPSIPASGPLTFTTSGDYKACNYIGWDRLTAYLDWSGLRPMTELEYEKLCRGPLPAVPNEHPWGAAAIADGDYTIADFYSANEGIVTGYNTTGGNINRWFAGPSASGPYRVGIFAAHPDNTGRATSGAGYFGAMELAGNVREGVVNIANAVGRSFTGAHGDGTLSITGRSNASGWPTDGSGGHGSRGGSFRDDLEDFNTSSRSMAVGPTVFWEGNGGRGVRTAP